MIEEHDRVVLTEPLPERDLQAGDVGTVVHVYENGTAYEVEFFRLDGRTGAVETLSASAVRPVASTDVPHARTREELGVHSWGPRPIPDCGGNENGGPPAAVRGR